MDKSYRLRRIRFSVLASLLLSAAMLLSSCGEKSGSDSAATEQTQSAEDVRASSETVSSKAESTTEAGTQADVEAAIRAYIEESKVLAGNGNFSEAFAALDTAEQLYGSSDALKEQRTAVNIAKVLYDASEYEKNKEYAAAIKCINDAPEDVKANETVIRKLNSLKNTYREEVLSSAEESFASDGYEKAISVINEGLKTLPDDEKLLDALEKYEEYIPVCIADIDYFSGRDFLVKNGIKDNLGETHDNVVFPQGADGWSNHSTKNVYKINKKYSRLTGYWFQRYDYRTEVKYGIGATKYHGEIEIYGDGKLLYSDMMEAGVEPKSIDLDISGVSELQINYFGGGSDASYSGVADFNIHK